MSLFIFDCVWLSYATYKKCILNSCICLLYVVNSFLVIFKSYFQKIQRCSRLFFSDLKMQFSNYLIFIVRLFMVWIMTCWFKVVFILLSIYGYKISIMMLWKKPKSNQSNDQSGIHSTYRNSDTFRKLWTKHYRVN